MRIVNLIRQIRKSKGSKPVFGDPKQFWLTYSDDPLTTIDIMYNNGVEFGTDTQIQYRKVGDDSWITEEGTNSTYPYTGDGFSRTKQLVHRVKLSALEADTDYEFKFRPTGKVRRFKTLNTTNVNGVFSGDCLFRGAFKDVCKAISKTAPDFVMLGGDWSYADGLESRFYRWVEFWNIWSENMITEDDRVIPVFPVIGNHEVMGGFGGSIPSDAIYYYTFFPYMEDEGGYAVWDIGDLLSVISLDTEHTNPEITGTDNQSVWLQDRLEERSDQKHLIPSYHIPSWPASSDWTGALRQRVRIWNAFFEEGGVKLAFEHHDHVYKRTELLKAGEIDPDGVQYMGDGSWGIVIRNVLNPATTFYLQDSYGLSYLEGLDGPHPDDGKLAEAETKGRHFYFVEFTTEKRVVKSINKFNEVFHEFEQNV